MSTAKYAILKAKIEGVLTEILVKTNASNVYVDDTTTLAAKLSEIIASIATKASTDDLTAGLATKANTSHTHEQADVNGLSDTLATLATTEAVNAAIAALKEEMLGDTPVEAYNTFTELAVYIAEHQEVSDSLTAAIGNKADKTAVEAIQATVDALGALAQLNKVSEDNLSDELKEKVNAASEGNHSHNNKDVIDGITAENITDWNDAVAKEHEHSNKAVLDGITATKVSAWDAAEQNAKDYADGLASNYDKAGAADQALTDAKAYSDELNAAMNTRVVAVEGKAHEHDNKTVLDGITAANITAWNAKANVYYSTTEPANMTDGDLWVQIVE